VHVARTLKEMALQVVKARDALTVTLNRSPTLAELGAHLGVDEEQVAEAMEAIGTRRQLSLDQPVNDEGTTNFGSLLPASANDLELEDRLALPALINGLGELERRAVVMCFYQGLKQAQIGAELGCSQMQVSRVLRRALYQLREQLSP
jgi:RNA polymerase sigma-B factor